MNLLYTLLIRHLPPAKFANVYWEKYLIKSKDSTTYTLLVVIVAIVVIEIVTLQMNVIILSMKSRKSEVSAKGRQNHARPHSQ